MRKDPDQSPRSALAPLNSWQAWLVYAYAFVAVLNALTPEYTECITDSWCLSSRGDWWLLALLQAGLLALLVVALRFGRLWAMCMLASPRRHWWFFIFFAVLGLGGIAAWLTTVPRGQWLDFAHIPAIGAFFIALGVLMFLGFRPRPRRPRRGKSS